MNILQLLNLIPDSAWTAQYVRKAAKKIVARVKPHKHTEITFGTDEITPSELMRNEGKIGLVIWIDRAEWEKHTK